MGKLRVRLYGYTLSLVPSVALMMSTLSQKICLVGDFGVGKTSLIRRFIDRQFSDRYLSTVGVRVSRKMIELPQTRQRGFQHLQLLIWDIEGNTKFKAIAPTYLQGARGAIMVGDTTRPETVDGLAQHIEKFLSINPKGFVVVALNKADLIDVERLERLKQRSQFQDPRVLNTYTTSAKTGEDVDCIFQTLAYCLIESNEFIL